MKNKISVIIPVNNTEQYLESCIESLLAQTYQNWEAILINDGSSDDSRAIIQSYEQEDARIKLIDLKVNKGVGHARNIGLDVATGEFIYFLDSDDTLDQYALGLLISNITHREVIFGSFNLQHKKANLTLPVKHKVKNSKAKFQSESVLNRLFRRSLIDELNLRFDENYRYYSDLTFLLPLIDHLKIVPTITGYIYKKQWRKDPDSPKSLTQEDDVVKIKEYVKRFHHFSQQYSENPKVIKFLCNQFISYYCQYVIFVLQEQEIYSEVLEDLSTVVHFVNNHSYSKKVSYFIKRELKAIGNRDEKKLRKLLKLHKVLRITSRSLSGRQKLYRALYNYVFTKLPMQNKTIVFESFLGKNYSDSPKNIYEELLNEKKDYKYIWVFAKTGKEIPGNAKQVKRLSLAYFYYMARAKYWVSNSRIPKALKKREGNVYLQTWHGTPLKKLVFDMNDVHSANPNYKADFFEQSRRWDYLISANSYSSEIFKRAFKFDNHMFEYGYPRNDILHSRNKAQLMNKIKMQLNIPLEKKVILYAPTWRDDEFYKPGKYKFTLRFDLQRLQEELGDEYVVLLRTHYFIADHLETENYEGFAYNVSKYDDISELYLIADILITDYSSVFFDYANLKRPILFFTYDLEKYRDTLRGFYIDMESELPGPLVFSNEEIINSIKNIDQVKDQYQDKYDQFYDRFCGWEQGNASKKISGEVFNS
ncbi:bifunctional glycosyltransferase family 2 protein/CDP-glycerol:glycerophosphate glycerophosphotransferase [Bacillus sp. RAR_GA_16]|uniref:bifunctional glycosyltransferase/CDP-glycerol:glycerophosphate glycerophosphotransferase n=1 Tax=Bacillus sp. RAR_GA_16 TaxID=2876774 RepID=UPI001CCB41EC|nr:bifunctional glycosyltransferase family 2 protein/CDP-glycerol:glycerophosphate glycerophosphotransferase [Bacillus sp. RAR_GA_16]MCA0174369.1 bifunctional glycosyltransferase family 2 protein/CDP-glycerol:glycerophosphate glycerophosphotransferase [Bacillus sp. RAR_GA_16]